MVLLFLGVIFLLMGFQAMSSGGDDDEAMTTVTTATTTSTTTPSPTPEAEPKAAVVLYNVTDDEAVGTRAAERLTEAGFKVTETRNQPLSGVTENTVFFGAPEEQPAADEIGQLLQAPVESRGSGFDNEPPGIIVAVTG